METIELTQFNDLVIVADNIIGDTEGQQLPSVTIPKPKGVDPRQILLLFSGISGN